MDTLESGFKTIWEWKSYLVEDTANWSGKSHRMSEKTLYKSVNKHLTVRPDTTGP